MGGADSVRLRSRPASLASLFRRGFRRWLRTAREGVSLRPTLPGARHRRWRAGHRGVRPSGNRSDPDPRQTATYASQSSVATVGPILFVIVVVPTFILVAVTVESAGKTIPPPFGSFLDLRSLNVNRPFAFAGFFDALITIEVPTFWTMLPQARNPRLFAQIKEFSQSLRHTRGLF